MPSILSKNSALTSHTHSQHHNTDTTTHHTLTHKQMYTSTPEQMYTSTPDNVRAALSVAVQVPKPEGAGIETRCRLFYGLFGRCHGECGLVVRKWDNQQHTITTSRGEKKSADFSIVLEKLNDCRIVSALWQRSRFLHLKVRGSKPAVGCFTVCLVDVTVSAGQWFERGIISGAQ